MYEVTVAPWVNGRRVTLVRYLVDGTPKISYNEGCFFDNVEEETREGKAFEVSGAQPDGSYTVTTVGIFKCKKPHHSQLYGEPNQKGIPLQANGKGCLSLFKKNRNRMQRLLSASIMKRLFRSLLSSLGRN